MEKKERKEETEEEEEEEEEEMLRLSFSHAAMLRLSGSQAFMH